MSDPYIECLTEAVTAMHGCDCSHLETAHVHEMMDAKTIWEGYIEVFTLKDHPEASKAFAWGFKDDAGEIQYIAVINKPPINSPREAVQAAIVSRKFQ